MSVESAAMDCETEDGTIENALILIYPNVSEGLKVKPSITTKRFKLKELKAAENPSDFVKSFAKIHGLEEYARAEGITGELEVKLFGRSFERTREFPEGRHNFVGPPGYKEDLETLYNDVKAKTHEVLIKVYEKKTRMFMQVRQNLEKRIISPEQKPVGPETEPAKKPRLESTSSPPVKNMTKRSRVVREEERNLRLKLKEKKEIVRNDREEAEFTAFKTEIEKVTFDGKWAKSGLQVDERGLVCAEAISEIDVKCPACGSILRMNKLRNSFNLTDHLKKTCRIAKAKKFNGECKTFDFSKYPKSKPLDGVGEKEKASAVDDPDIQNIDSPTPPEVQPTNVEEGGIGFSGESSFGFQYE